ncbi:MAG: hypothetical protein ACO1SV_22515 [Fimbriimonas sp.]
MNTNWNLKKTLAVILAVAAYGAAHTAATDPTPAHLTKAETLVTTLRTQGLAGNHTAANGKALNNYGASWADAYAVWGPTATVDAQCSSFVTLVLQSSYAGWSAKKAGFTTASPTAAMYYDAIEADKNGFAKVDEFEDVRPGDFLMAKYLDENANTGHAMIVRNAAVVDTDETTGVSTWSVQVIDCSSSTHSNDTREFTQTDGSTLVTKGAGRGTMRVLTKEGDIVGYSWSFRSGSTIYPPDIRPLVLGRLG